MTKALKGSGPKNTGPITSPTYLQDGRIDARQHRHSISFDATNFACQRDVMMTQESEKEQEGIARIAVSHKGRGGNSPSNSQPNQWQHEHQIPRAASPLRICPHSKQTLHPCKTYQTEFRHAFRVMRFPNFVHRHGPAAMRGTVTRPPANRSTEQAETRREPQIVPRMVLCGRRCAMIIAPRLESPLPNVWTPFPITPSGKSFSTFSAAT
jgi:hypothetical protein